MEIRLNNEQKEIPSNFTIQQLMDECIGTKQNGIAVAINNTVVPKLTWQSQPISQGDNILIIKATQGG